MTLKVESTVHKALQMGLLSLVCSPCSQIIQTPEDFTDKFMPFLGHNTEVVCIALLQNILPQLPSLGYSSDIL